MKLRTRHIVLISAIAIFAAALGIGLNGGTFSTHGVSAEGASVINTGQGTGDPESCGLPGADANGDLTLGGIGVSTVTVENNRWVRLVCHGDGIDNLSGTAQTFGLADFLATFPTTFLGCGIQSPGDAGFVLTNDVQATVSESGHVSMVCVYDKG